MTNILVPTDFTPASVKMAEGALKSGHYDKCNIVLFHAFDLPSSPFDMLGTGYKDPACELLTEAFRLACKQLKDDNAKLVNKVIVRCMTGSTKAVFRNFAEANDIDLIFCPDDYYFKPVHPRSVDACSFFQKSGVPVVKKATWKTENVFEPAYFNTIPVSAQ